MDLSKAVEMTSRTDSRLSIRIGLEKYIVGDVEVEEVVVREGVHLVTPPKAPMGRL